MEDKILKILADVCEDECVREDREINLFEEGLLDSLGFAELLVDLEDELGVTIPISSVDRREIETPAKLISYVMSRSDSE